MTTFSPNKISRAELFKAFFFIGATSFGGAQAWAKRMLVDKKKWLNEEGFSEILAIGQIVPGPNVVNLSIIFGKQTHGAIGSALAVSGLLACPLLVASGLALLYKHAATVPSANLFFNGVAMGTAGLLFATGLKLYLKTKRSWVTHTLVWLTFFLGIVLNAPLWMILIALIPFGTVCVALNHRDQSKLN